MLMPTPQEAEKFMSHALAEADKALELGEIPVGAVVTHKGRIIGRGHNQTELLKDPTAHAEMIAITAATQYMGSKYLWDCVLYVTLEPCMMCGSAIGWAQVPVIIFGATDDKKGFHTFKPSPLHPKAKVFGGVLGEEAEAMLNAFFQQLRKK